MAGDDRRLSSPPPRSSHCSARRGAGAVVVAGGLLALMVATKTRLFLLAVPIMAGFVPSRAGWRAVAALGALAGIAFAAAAVYEGVASMGPLGRRVRAGGLWPTFEWLLTWIVWAPTELRGHLGLVLDQEFGVLLSAPVIALSLAGAVVAARQRRWRYVLLTAGPFLLAWYYLGAVALSRSRFDQHWHAGFSPPGRFVAAALPLLAVCGATMLDRLRTRFAWTVAAGLYASTLAQTVLVSIRPDWRFNRGVGRATPLAELFASTGLDAGRLLPSYVSPGRAWVAPGLVVLAAIALAASWRRGERARRHPAPHGSPEPRRPRSRRWPCPRRSGSGRPGTIRPPRRAAGTGPLSMESSRSTPERARRHGSASCGPRGAPARSSSPRGSGPGRIASS